MFNHFVRIKVYVQRSAIYYQMIQYLLIIVLFLRPYGLNLWLEIIVILFVCFIAILIGRLDRRFVLEPEQSYFNTKNKEVKDILETLKRIEAQNERRSSCTCNTIGDTCSDHHFLDNWR